MPRAPSRPRALASLHLRLSPEIKQPGGGVGFTLPGLEGVGEEDATASSRT